MLKDALAKALAGQGELTAREPPATTPQAKPWSVALPEPTGSKWATELGRHIRLPAGASIGRMRQESDQLVRQLKKSGRRRDARDLAKFRDEFLKNRQTAAWKAVKVRWTELKLSDKGYRRLKQSDLDAERVLMRLHTRAADSFEGRAPAAVLDWLSKK
jgi:hypothetical protein